MMKYEVIRKRVFEPMLLVLALCMCGPEWSPARTPRICGASFQLIAQANQKGMKIFFSDDSILRIATHERPAGPVLRLQTMGVSRSEPEAKELVIGQFNVFNLMRLRGKFKEDASTGLISQVRPEREKALSQRQEIAATIRRADPDIMVMQEVEDIETLRTFVADFLDDSYHVMLLEGNDLRRIDIGFIVKKDLPFDYELYSHKQLTMGEIDGTEQDFASDMPVFSRDLPILVVRTRGADEDTKPVLVLGGTHFKSKRDRRRDPESQKLRSQQIQTAASILSGFIEQFSREVPTFLVGDFNTDLRTAVELDPLRDLGMRDSFDIATESRVDPEDRITHTYHPKNLPTVRSQLDGILVFQPIGSEPLVEIQSAEVVPYLTESGLPKQIPGTQEERAKLPSDHRMVKARIRLN